MRVVSRSSRRKMVLRVMTGTAVEEEEGRFGGQEMGAERPLRKLVSVTQE